VSTRPSEETFVVLRIDREAASGSVIHEIFGMTDWVQDLADQVAAAGYIAVAPICFRMAPTAA